jgi:hypothetical protein
MDNKYFDFDAYMEERKGTEKPFIIKAFGEKHEIPNDIPFDIVLSISRDAKENGGVSQMSDQQMTEMANLLFGEETFQKWLKAGIGLKGVFVMVEKVLEMYMTNASDLSQNMAARKKEEQGTP